MFQKKTLITLAAALGLGVLLHFLFHWLPSPITALISPVRESLWEHLKILLLPLLLAAGQVIENLRAAGKGVFLLHLGQFLRDDNGALFERLGKAEAR